MAKSIRSTALQIATDVPHGFRKPGLGGNVHLDFVSSHFAQLEVMCEAAEILGFAEPGHFKMLLTQTEPIRAEFRVLQKAARQQTKELMAKRSSAFGMLEDEDDD